MWHKLPNKKFLKKARRVVRVIWTRKFYGTNTKSRRIVIKDKQTWNKFIGSCYLPWYKKGNWDKIRGINYKVIEATEVDPIKLKRKKGLVIVTCYDTLLKKRLVVDGCHRAIAIQSSLDKLDAFPSVEVLECYGPEVHMLFFADFNNFIYQALKK